MTKAPLNILRTDIEDVAEAIKLKLMARARSAQIGVDTTGDVSIIWAGGDDVPADWLVGVYTRKAKVDDIEFDLVERMRELQARQGKQRAATAPKPAPAPKRTAAQQPTVVRRVSKSALGCIPAPATKLRSEAPVARSAGPDTVAEFRARGGKIEHLQGFETVREHLTRPAWRNAA